MLKIKRRTKCKSKKKHKLQRGENLKSLSIKYYGTDAHWRKIYDANSALIGRNPHTPLNDGDVLCIPKNVS